MNLSREKVELVMARRGWSITELARRMKTSRANISILLQRAQSGANLRPLTISRFADALSVDPAELVGETHEGPVNAVSEISPRPARRKAART